MYADRYQALEAHSLPAWDAGCLHLQLDLTPKPSFATGAVAEAEAGQEGVAEAQHLPRRLLLHLLLHRLQRTILLLLLQTHLLEILLLVMRVLSTWALHSRQPQVGHCPYPANMSLQDIASELAPYLPVHANVLQVASSMLGSSSGA